MARPRGLYAGAGPGVAPSRDGVLLHGHLLGDLAGHEAPIPHDITPRVSLSFLLFLFRFSSDFSPMKFLDICSWNMWGREVDNFDKIYSRIHLLSWKIIFEIP